MCLPNAMPHSSLNAGAVLVRLLAAVCAPVSAGICGCTCVCRIQEYCTEVQSYNFACLVKRLQTGLHPGR